MSVKSPFAIQKALIGIGGEPKSVKRLRSGDLLIETTSALQTLSPFFLRNHFLIDLPKLPNTIKAGYLHCKIRPYIPNPLRCFKCQRFGHSQTACRGQLTCSRCASVGHASSDCTLEQRCVNCSQPHSSDSKLCPKWKIEKQIQEIKTNNNISYQEARTLITPQLSQTYAQVAKSSTATSTTQTDENITRIKCPPLQLLQPLLSVPQPNKYPSITSVSTSSSTIQANLLPSASSIKPTTKIASRLPKPISSAAAPDNSLNTSASSLSAETRTLIRSNKSAARARFQLKFNPYQNLTLLHPMVNILMHLKSHSVQNEIQEIEESARKYRKQKLKSKWLHIDLESQHLQSQQLMRRI
ncbi:uncharacterized protein TNCV_3603861 [Trichonephila clavipes]|nr:uncharacterized protein TNCV_3603861 [Trichonephila clavipes]